MAWLQQIMQAYGGRVHVTVKDFAIELRVWGEPHSDHHSTVINLSVAEAKELITDLQRTIAVMEAPKT